MNRFRVEFWFYTDLRTDVEVEAPDQVSALVLALIKVGGTWPTHVGFAIKVVAT